MKKLFIYAPCAILITVALFQIYITHTHRLLTPAKGGGFGMFSTVDKLTNRILVIYQHADDQRHKLTVDPGSEIFKKHISTKWETAAAYPTQTRLDNLADAIAYYLYPEISHFTIEVSRCSFDQESLQVSPISLASFTYVNE